jgi:hypothetical protein
MKRIIKKIFPGSIQIYVKLRTELLAIAVEFADSGRGKWLRSHVPFFLPRRNLARQAHGLSGNHSSRRLNQIAEYMNSASTYLEIGVADGSTLEAVKLPFKWGVDPQPTFNHYLLPEGCRFSVATSDVFFEEISNVIKFDLIFLDGLHHWEQTYKDLVNSFSHANQQTIILMDDVIPSDEFSSWRNSGEAVAARLAAGGSNYNWHGDTYKVLIALKDYHPELEWCVINEEPNPQAIIWKKKDQDVVQCLAPFNSYDSVNYADVFVDGSPPTYFNCVSENEALDLVESALALKIT